MCVTTGTHGSRPGTAAVRKAAGATGAAGTAAETGGAARRSMTQLVTVCWKFGKTGNTKGVFLWDS